MHQNKPLLGPKLQQYFLAPSRGFPRGIHLTPNTQELENCFVPVALEIFHVSLNHALCWASTVRQWLGMMPRQWARALPENQVYTKWENKMEFCSTQELESYLLRFKTAYVWRSNSSKSCFLQSLLGLPSTYWK